MDSFAPHLNTTSGKEQNQIETELLRATARYPLSKRPGRKEPRAEKNARKNTRT